MKEFRLKIILETLKERTREKELYQKYDLHSNQIVKWMEDFLNKVAEIMDADVSKKNKKEFLK